MGCIDNILIDELIKIYIDSKPTKEQQIEINRNSELTEFEIEQLKFLKTLNDKDFDNQIKLTKKSILKG